MAEVICIDGSLMEGGGQILRNVVAFSCLTKQNVKLFNIRGNRKPKPGLRPQHLHGIKLISAICDADVEGDHPDSMNILFKPRKIQGGNFHADTQTAGSVCLIIQLVIPCLCFAEKPSTLVLKGGTNADMAPPIDFYLKVFRPVVSKFGVMFDCQIVRKGFYPKGGGEVKVTIDPSQMLTPVILTDFGKIQRINICAYVAGNLPVKVAYAMANSAKRFLEKHNNISIDVDVVKDDEWKAYGSGCGIIIVAETSAGCILSGDAVGKKGKPSEEVGLEAAEKLHKSLSNEACIDIHMQDQVIVFMALASGRSRIRTTSLTLHTETAIYIAEKLTTAKFTVTKEEDDVCIIECDGCGYKTY